MYSSRGGYNFETMLERTHPIPPRDRTHISRRCFLAGATAGALTGCMGVEARLDAPRRSPAAGTRWAMLSDVHIDATESTWWNAANPAANLRRAVDEAATYRPQHVLIAGDVSFHYGRPADYATFGRIINPLVSGETSLVLLPGNHDDRSVLREAQPGASDSPVAGKSVAARDIGGVRWVFLDTLTLTAEIGGDMGGAQLDWLSQVLDNAPAQPTIVVLHHNPEDYVFGLRDGASFLPIVLSRRQVKAVMFGHTHAYRLWTQQGLHFVNLPSTGYLFHLLPQLGWVLADVYEDGMRLDFRPMAGKGRQLYLEWRV